MGIPDPAFLLLYHENSESRTSVIAIPNIIFFLNPHPCLLANSASRLAVKSRICQRFPEPRTVSWSNPASRQCFPESRPVFWSNPASRQRFPESRTAFWSNPASRQCFPESRNVFWSNAASRKYPSRP